MITPTWILMLAYALMHSIWQFSAIGALCWLTLKIIPVRHARLRHSITRALLYLMPVTFVFTCIQFVPGNVILPTEAAPVATVNIIAPLISIIWAAGAIAGLIRLGFNRLAIHQLAQERYSALPADIRLLGYRLKRRMGIGRSIDIRLSDAVSGPCTFAFWKPIILIPASCIAQLSAKELEAVIAHELAHIKRFDSLHRTIQSVLEAMFFYHPIVTYVSRQMSLEREHDCDDVALEAIDDPKPLATGLLKAGIISADNAFILGARTHDIDNLENRISRIVSLSGSEMRSNRISARLALSASLLMTLASVSFVTALAWADKASASMFTRPMLVNLKDAACDQIKEARLYDDPKYYRGGPATLRYSENMITMNDVALPKKTQTALRGVFQEFQLSGYQEVKLRYWGDSIKLVLKTENGGNDEAPYVFRVRPDTVGVDAFRLTADS